jgi:hypothetical protein
MTTRRVFVCLLLLAAGALAGAQPANLTGAAMTVRQADRDFVRQAQTLASDPASRWIGWEVPATSDHSSCCWSSSDGWGSGGCCGRCRLEPGSSRTVTQIEGSRSVRLEEGGVLRVFARSSGGQFVKVRAFSSDCAVDAAGAAVVWIERVDPETSVALLEKLASLPSVSSDGDLSSSALAALAEHGVPAADRALERLAAPSQPRRLREKAAFWLGNARGRAGYEILRRIAPEDSDEDFRRHATFAFSQSREPEAVTTLIGMAKRDPSPSVRGQALFWLAQKAGHRAAGAIEDAIRDDPETEVKTKAVFALTQMPDGEGVPKLIEVARTNRNAEVRKKAIFWLGQSKDPRALAFFEEVLTR